MSIVKKVKINNFMGLGKLRIYYFFDFPLLQVYRNEEGKRKWSLFHQNVARREQRIFYLKINQTSRTAFICMQRWHDVADLMGGFIYFVCDNNELKFKVLNQIWFHNLNFKFIRSNRTKLKNVLKRIIVRGGRKWRIIGHAMMTPFLHAAKHRYPRSYNIDADDIEIFLRPQLVAKALTCAEEHANKSELDCFNLDMFVSRSFGTHWSFGCVYVRNPQKCVDAVIRNKNYINDRERISRYKVDYVLDTSWHDDNVDWFFSFLRDSGQLVMGTFYIENAYVVHMPDIVFEHEWAFYFKWSEGHVYHPVLDREYGDNRWAILPIARGIVKIDINLSDEDKYDYLRNYRFCDNKFREHCLQVAFDRGVVDRETYDKYMNSVSW